MGIIKRVFSDALIRKFYHREGSSASSGDSESEDSDQNEVMAETGPCESLLPVLDGQTDIRSYFPASWRWQLPVEDFTGDEEAAEAMGLPFDMQEDDEALMGSSGSMAEAALDIMMKDMGDISKSVEEDEDAATAMGLPFHMWEDDEGVSSTHVLAAEVELAQDDIAESMAADEEAAHAMGLPFHMDPPPLGELVPLKGCGAKKAETESLKGNFGTPTRRRPRQALEETPCKKPRVLSEVVVATTKLADSDIKTHENTYSIESSVQSTVR
ncbi:unnamed protein product [Symbiodinium natans]|uniref:Uncharacterized protein n=1 Tax=Symbiodinium natans TaxID=878477 RepID=A0A812QER7_9DINO|nr:unnamed protein product [Symbiodinium natans]